MPDRPRTRTRVRPALPVGTDARILLSLLAAVAVQCTTILVVVLAARP